MGNPIEAIRVKAYVFDGMARLSKKDLKELVGFLGDAQSIEGSVPFTHELLERMTTIFRCEYSLYNEFDFARRRVLAYIPCSADEADGFEMTDADWDELVAELELDRKVERNGIVTTSEHYSREQRVRFEVGPRYHGELEIVDTMCARIGPPGARFVLNSRERDFDVRDRLLMHELQPHLLGLWNRASTTRRLTAALAAVDQDATDGVVFVDDRGNVEFASVSAEKLVQTHLGVPAVPLPENIAKWRENGLDLPLVIASNDSRLVVRAANSGSTLLLSAEVAGAALLTRREREVMRGVAAGLSNQEIAQRLWIEVPTVRKHLEHVFEKLGVHSRTAAVAKLQLR